MRRVVIYISHHAYADGCGNHWSTVKWQPAALSSRIASGTLVSRLSLRFNSLSSVEADLRKRCQLILVEVQLVSAAAARSPPARSSAYLVRFNCLSAASCPILHAVS